MLLCMCKLVFNETPLTEQTQESASGVKGTKQKRFSLKEKHVPLLVVFLNSFYVPLREKHYMFVSECSEALPQRFLVWLWEAALLCMC